MNGETLGFIIWCMAGTFFVFLGVYARFSKKPVGFWANAKVPDIADIKGYNKAMSRLYLAFALIFIILGLPLLGGQNSAWVILSIFGVVAEVIGMMIVYTLVIEKKYKRK